MANKDLSLIGLLKQKLQLFEKNLAIEIEQDNKPKIKYYEGCIHAMTVAIEYAKLDEMFDPVLNKLEQLKQEV
jgi:hypothetical protein